jgi:hypothetical protein
MSTNSDDLGIYEGFDLNNRVWLIFLLCLLETAIMSEI